jgi:hypothetical protein
LLKFLQQIIPKVQLTIAPANAVTVIAAKKGHEVKVHLKTRE